MYLSKFQKSICPNAMVLVTVEDWSEAKLGGATGEGESSKGCVCSLPPFYSRQALQQFHTWQNIIIKKGLHNFLEGFLDTFFESLTCHTYTCWLGMLSNFFLQDFMGILPIVFLLSSERLNFLMSWNFSNILEKYFICLEIYF